jgi:hypothetical protein
VSAESPCKYCPKIVVWATLTDENGNDHRMPLEPCDHGLYVVMAGSVVVEVTDELAERCAANGVRRYADHRKLCTRMPSRWDGRSSARRGVAA